MPSTKISALSAVTTPDGADLLPVVQSGTSKKMTLSQLRTSSPTVPTIVSVGTEFSSTATPTATLPPTHAQDDILVLVLQTSNQNHGPPGGYTQLGPRNGVGDATLAGATRLEIYWKRDNGSESAPTLLDSGDHTYGVMFAVRGCPTTGDPFRMIGQAWKFTGSTTGTADAGTCRTPNSLVVNIFAHAIDGTGAQGSSPTNASLSSVTERFDGSTADGTGGGIYIMSGISAGGPVSASTVTWAASTVDVSTTIAFVSADSYPVPRGPETMTFIGSSADLDDNYVMPYGARKILAQLCDGGGGGSSGNTTTTAAGGGGGGGGGYDEAWYEAEDLPASVTVHAGKGGAATTALNQAGNPGVLSEFDKGAVRGPLTSSVRVAGTAATAAASADGGNGGCGSGRGSVSPAVSTTRLALTAATAGTALGGVGGRGGSGTTAPTGGSEGEWGGGGGESGGDTDAAITSANNGNSMRGGGGGAGGRTNTNVSGSGAGGGAFGVNSANGAAGNDSSRLPCGGSGGCGGGSGTATGGPGGFPGGGGGGGAGVAGGFGGRGGHGIVMVTAFF